ncbi:MAG: endonuclease V [Marine Group I thaumarchaeote]|nr:MAG: endonuclease V [Marine Group I thaumarchaeote]
MIDFSIYSDVIALQQDIAKKVIARNILPPQIKYIAGVDVAYKDNTAYCSGVILNKKTLKTIKTVGKVLKVKYPYIPGMFMLRESNPILSTLKLFKSPFDVLLVDGHGKLHPRRSGLACYIGVKINKPVIGVAKSLLCGTEKQDKVVLDGKIMGNVIKINKKKIYVSVGHKVSQKTALKITRELILDGYWYPEPLRLAHINSKKMKNLSQ